jgi:hypothetical protein
MTDAHLVAHHEGLEQEPPLGAHLATSRRGYHHHGVYVGRGRVVHYSGLSGFWQCGPVEEVSLSRFANGHPVRVVNHLESHYSPEELVRRARSRLGEKDGCSSHCVFSAPISCVTSAANSAIPDTSDTPTLAIELGTYSSNQEDTPCHRQLRSVCRPSTLNS